MGAAESTIATDLEGGSHEQLNLVTISFSHYCEAARWALQLTSTPFKEIAYLPGFHVYSDADKIRGKRCPEDPKLGTSSGSSLSLPLLYTWNNFTHKHTVVGNDSFEIIEKFLGPIDESRVAGLKTLLDEEIGPTVRTLFYSHLLKATPEGDATLVRIAWEGELPGLIQKTPFCSLGETSRAKVVDGMYEELVQSAEHVAECRARFNEAIAKIEPFLDQEPFVLATGDDDAAPTPAAIMLASLLYPLAFPPEFDLSYAGKEMHGENLALLPVALKEEVEAFRVTKAGAFALAVYKKHRLGCLSRATAATAVPATVVVPGAAVDAIPEAGAG